MHSHFAANFSSGWSG